jgi:hypothetical protein
MKMAGPLTHLPALLPQELWRHASVGTLRVFKDGEAAVDVAGLSDFEGNSSMFSRARAARGCKAIGEAQHRRAVYKGFCDAKLVMPEQYTRGMTFNNMAMMLPWLTKLTDEDRSLLGEDWWPYGMEAKNLLGPITRWEFPMTLWKFYCNEDAYPSMWQRWFLNQYVGVG